MAAAVARDLQHGEVGGDLVEGDDAGGQEAILFLSKAAANA
jgi:hypothetical protein